MKKLTLLGLVVLLFGLAFLFYKKSESLKQEHAALQSIITPSNSDIDDTIYKPTPEPKYDPKNLSHSPPGVTPFLGSSLCVFTTGLQLRQYCENGDNAILDKIEEITQEEVRADFVRCVDDYIQRKDAYGDPDMRPMDSQIPLNETSRKAFACDYTARYGDSSVFDKSTVDYLVKEDLESGNIDRLENR